MPKNGASQTDRKRTKLSAIQIFAALCIAAMSPPEKLIVLLGRRLNVQIC